MVLIRALSISLIATIVLEALIFFVSGKRDRKDLLLLVLVNIMTNPIVVLLYWLASGVGLNLILMTVVLEAGAVLAEGFYYKHYGRNFPHPFRFSIVANVFSYGVGFIVQLLFPGVL